MEQYLIKNPWFLLLMLLWVLPWKGVALWKSARNNQKWWFIFLLAINTLAILPIIYIFYFSRKKPGESQKI
jgi:hypothetical protein